MAEASLGGVPVGDGRPVRIMAVINASPESFYGRSVASGPEEAVERALRWAKYVDFVDVGGMSTAPYKETWVPAEVEAERVIPVVKALSEAVEAPVSVDTFRPKVAEAALRAGARIINDVTGLKLYPELCGVAVDHDASMILMARERAARPGLDPIDRVADALRESLEIAYKCGLEPEHIAVDPGIGFPLLPPSDQPHVVKGDDRHGDPAWPFWRWDLRILAGLPKLRDLGRPIVVGVSRKTFIRRILGLHDPEAVAHGSTAAEAAAVLQGAHVVRTHNPPETWQAVRLAEAVRAGGHKPPER